MWNATRMAWFVTVESGAVYYLGNSCDAVKPGGGEGRWWLAASAIAVEINGSVEALIRFGLVCRRFRDPSANENLHSGQGFLEPPDIQGKRAL